MGPGAEQAAAAPEAPFEHTDVATLSATIVKGSGVKITLDFYYRVAFLVRCAYRLCAVS